MRERIAWYSEAEMECYHVCRNCQYNEEILWDNIVIGTEEQVQDDFLEEGFAPELCVICVDLIRNGREITFTLND